MFLQILYHLPFISIFYTAKQIHSCFEGGATEINFG